MILEFCLLGIQITFSEIKNSNYFDFYKYKETLKNKKYD